MRTRRTRLWLAGAAALLIALTTAFWWTGTLLPTVLPDYASSPLEITGMALMLILTPAYLVAAHALGRERSLDLVDQLRSELEDARAADAAQAEIERGLRSTWPVGLVLGSVLALFNTRPIEAFTSSTVPAIAGSISLGQLLLWGIIGLLLGTRYRTAHAFRQLGTHVRVELFRLDRLRPLARAGMVDVVIIAGALAFSPLQALDAEIRLENYQFALVVALPAAAFALFWPLVPLHRRIRGQRQERLEAADTVLDAIPFSSARESAELSRIEALLAYRDRLASAPTWPLGMRLISRVFVYLVIPPLAWAGAALVERIVDRLVTG